jgi:hypothetical protein
VLYKIIDVSPYGPAVLGLPDTSVRYLDPDIKREASDIAVVITLLVIFASCDGRPVDTALLLPRESGQDGLDRCDQLFLTTDGRGTSAVIVYQ